METKISYELSRVISYDMPHIAAAGQGKSYSNIWNIINLVAFLSFPCKKLIEKCILFQRCVFCFFYLFLGFDIKDVLCGCTMRQGNWNNSFFQMTVKITKN